jgi:Flp pilus assembly protein TadD
MRYAFAADRFQYLASMGLIILFSAILWRLLNTSLLKKRSILLYGTMSLVLIVLGVMTFLQAGTFRDYETLFRHNVEKNPHSYAAHNNLATALEEKGDLHGAENHYKKALELKPDEYQVHYNLGALYAKIKQEDKAVYHYEQAIRINPENSSAYNNLGFIFAQKGDLDKAIDHYKIALSLRPDHPRTLFNMGNALMLKGDTRGAVGNYKRAFQLDPRLADLANTLAWILATNGDPMIRNGKEAVLYAEMACKDTGYKEAAILDTLAAAYAEAGRFSEAASTAQKAIEKAEKSQDKSVVEEMKKRLQLYQDGKAYHENE